MRFALVVLLLLLGRDALAQELTVRVDASGEYEAVLSRYWPGCGPLLAPVESTTFAPGQITIVGQDLGPYICGLPTPGGNQTVVAPLGSLLPGQYHLEWTQPNLFSVSIVFVVPSPPIPIPTLSIGLLAFLGLLVVLVALRSNYLLNRTVGDMLRSNQFISALGRLARR